MNINVLDTTLRDGEQTPGVSLTPQEKLRIATKLDEIGVEFIEAGSAITSKDEQKSIKRGIIFLNDMGLSECFPSCPAQG